jgi:hypothetical protein
MKKLSSIFHIDHVAKPGKFRRRYFWHEVGENPFIDWVIIFSLSVFIAMVLVVVGAYVYVNVDAELSSPSAAASQNHNLRFDAQELDRIIGTFDARAAERVLLNKVYAGPSDPSLP